MRGLGGEGFEASAADWHHGARVRVCAGCQPLIKHSSTECRPSTAPSALCKCWLDAARAAPTVAVTVSCEPVGMGHQQQKNAPGGRPGLQVLATGIGDHGACELWQ